MNRAKEITEAYLKELDKHTDDPRSGKAATTFEIKDIAALLHIHPTHLRNTIQAG